MIPKPLKLNSLLRLREMMIGTPEARRSSSHPFNNGHSPRARRPPSPARRSTPSFDEQTPSSQCKNYSRLRTEFASHAGGQLTWGLGTHDERVWRPPASADTRIPTCAAHVPQLSAVRMSQLSRRIQSPLRVLRHDAPPSRADAGGLACSRGRPSGATCTTRRARAMRRQPLPRCRRRALPERRASFHLMSVGKSDPRARQRRCPKCNCPPRARVP